MPWGGGVYSNDIGVLGVLVLLFGCVLWGVGCCFFGFVLIGCVWCLVGGCFVCLCWGVGFPGFLPSIEVALTL